MAPGVDLGGGLSKLLLVAMIFSVLGPVPINNRVVGWDPERPPAGWEKERARWDQLHLVRVAPEAAQGRSSG